jgi:hypothetical protein
MHSLKIVTIHLNNSAGFKKTFYSVLPLLNNYKSVQWLIKDGNSNEIETGKILACLEKVESSTCALIKKDDRGIYDAMNQALDYVQDEEMILFLNAGDELSGDFIKNFDEKNLIGADIIYSDTIIDNTILKSPSQLDFAYLLGKTINHQSLIIRGKWLKKFPFNTNYRIVSDWVQLFEILASENVFVRKHPFPICIYEGGGISEQQDELRKSERQQFLNANYSEWELDSLEHLRALRQRSWYDFIIKSLDSPKRSAIISLISRWIK